MANKMDSIYRELGPNALITTPNNPETVPSPIDAIINMFEVESGHKFLPKWIGTDRNMAYIHEKAIPSETALK